MVSGRGRLLLVATGVAAVALLAIAVVGRYALDRPAEPEAQRPTSASTPRSDLSTVAVADLPPQGRDTLALVDRAGPYPYRQDGTTFNNFERLLPAQPRGYYREFTVPTPGERDRGARRLVVGRDGDVYYTDDHYESFRQVVR